MASVAHNALPIETDDAHWPGWLFVLTIFVGSFLLFLVQPMIARMALPRLGGAPAVWNSAMLVYQALLLGGYAYAHALGRLSISRQAVVHIALLAAAAFWLPIGLAAIYPSATANPALWVPYLLALSIGPLFFVVSAQAPLIQRWYSVASGGRDPYALYAASNLGSFGGLIAYPLIVEPRLALADQSLLWSSLYAVLGVLVLACASMLPRGRIATIDLPESEPAPLRRRLMWVLLAFVPSGLMLSTTTYITTDIVAMPLLWVLPLGLYLLSFSVAFAHRRGLSDSIGRLSPFVLLIFGALSIRNGAAYPLQTMAASLTLLFTISVALHGAMYRLRPAPDRLTGFYLAMSVGGVLGGIFSGLLAPLVFDWTYEHPLLLVLAGVLVPLTSPVNALQRLWNDDRRALPLTLFIAVAIIILFFLSVTGRADDVWVAFAITMLGVVAVGRRAPFLIALSGALLVLGVWQAFELTSRPEARTRSYFGIYTIRDHPDEATRTLAHGTTYHGLEILKPGRLREPTSYYGPHSGVGQALLALASAPGEGAARIGVVGLGTGTLACYARPSQHWTYFEIDPAVVHIARDSGKFHFLQACLPDVPIVIGDARLTVTARPAASLDLLALDAFSSDTVPMHLLTREAFDTYARALAPKGVLLVHISNRFLDLEPVVAEAARAGGWTAMIYNDHVDPNSVAGRYLSSSTWVALSRDPAMIAAIVARAPKSKDSQWRKLNYQRGFTEWTDDFASILPLIKAWMPNNGEAR
jgi:spermidine synthase